MNWDDVISIIKQLQSLKNNFPIIDGISKFMLMKKHESEEYVTYSLFYDFSRVFDANKRFIAVSVNKSNIKLEPSFGSNFTINLDIYDIDQYTLTHGRPPGTIELAMNMIEIILKASV